MIDQINELPKDGLKSSPETSCCIENQWISRKNQNKLCIYVPKGNGKTYLGIRWGD